MTSSNENISVLLAFCVGNSPVTSEFPTRRPVIKGSNMIVCVLLVSNSLGCCLAAPGDHKGAARVIAPWRDNTWGSLTPTIHTQSCLIPIITWCHHFSTATNILLIKSNLKFESRATAVSVAMSPRYLGGKYRSRLHPGRENARASFCGRLGMWNRTAPDRHHLLPLATTKLIVRCV